jgi:hypothetical protein
VAARTADAKWTWDVGKHRMVEAFDLTRDPGERHPITARRSRRAWR